MGTNSHNTTDNCSPLCSETSNLVAEIIALVTIVLLSSLGNILILVVVRRSRRNEWTTNYFVTGLAISNLLTPFLSVVWTLVWLVKGTWVLHDVTCKVTFFTHFFNTAVSAGLLACISMDRYYVIVHPLKLKMTRAQTRELITFVWVLMLCVSAPSLFVFKAKVTTGNDSPESCRIDFFHTMEKAVFLVYVAVALCLPSIFTCVVYIRVSIAVFRRNRQARRCQDDYRRLAFRVPKSKVKVMRMFVIQWLVFIACCFPYYATMSAEALGATEIPPSSSVHLLIWSFSNAGFNVIIYAIFNGDFRAGCKRVFCKRDSSQAYRLTTLGRKNRIAPAELSSADHGEGFDFRLHERSEKDQTTNGAVVSTHRSAHAWASPEPTLSDQSASNRTMVSEISKV